MSDLPKRIAQLAESITAERDERISSVDEVWETLADVCRIFQAQSEFNNAVAEHLGNPFGLSPAITPLDIRTALADVVWPDNLMREIPGEPGWRIAPDGSKHYSSRWL